MTLRPFIPYLAALLIGALLAYYWQHNRYTAELSELREQYARASQQAVTQALEEQQRQNAVPEQTDAQGAAELEQIRTITIIDTAGADRLRDELTAVRARANRENASLATQREADRQTINMLSGLYQGADERASTLAAAFEDARARGLTCERTYDGIRGI